MPTLYALLLESVAPAGIYALVSVGLVLIYRATKVLNFAQGGMVLIGAYLLFSLQGSLSIALRIVVLLIVSGLIGAAIYYGLLDRLLGHSPLSIVMMTIVLSTFLESIVGLAWGQDGDVSLILPVSTGPVRLPGGGVIGASDILIGAVAVVFVALVGCLLRFTRIGLSMRAAADNSGLASYRGVNVRRTSAIAWGLSMVAATLAGVGSGALDGVNGNLLDIGLAAFPALLLGGVDSIVGVCIASVILGFLGSIIQTYLSADWLNPLMYSILLVTVLVRPSGLMGTPETARRV